MNDLPLFFSSQHDLAALAEFGPQGEININDSFENLTSSKVAILKPTLGNSSDLELSIYLEETLGPENFLILTFDNSQNTLMKQSVDDFVFCYMMVDESELHTFSGNPDILEQEVSVAFDVVEKTFKSHKFSSKNLVNCWLEEPHSLVLTNFGKNLNKQSTVKFRINGLHFTGFLKNLKPIKIENNIKLPFPLFSPPSKKKKNLFHLSKEQNFSLVNLDSLNIIDYLFNSIDKSSASLKLHLHNYQNSQICSTYLPLTVSHQTSLTDSDSLYSETLTLGIIDQPSLDSPEPLKLIDLFFKERISLTESDCFLLFSSPRRLSSTSVFTIKSPSLFQEISLSRSRDCSLFSFSPPENLYSLTTVLRGFFTSSSHLNFESTPSPGSPTYESYSRLLSENVTFQVFEALTFLYQPALKTLFLAQNPSLSTFMANNNIDLSSVQVKVHYLSQCLKNGDVLKFYLKRNTQQEKDFIEKETLVLLKIPSMPTDKDAPKLSLTISDIKDETVLLQSSVSVTSPVTWKVPMFQNPLLLNSFLDPAPLSFQFFQTFDLASTSTSSLSTEINNSLDSENSISSSETIFYVLRGIYNNLQARLSASNVPSSSSTWTPVPPLSSLWHLFSPDKVEYFLLEDYNGIFSLDQALAINSLGLSHLSLSLGVARSASPSLYYLKFTHKETMFPNTLQKLPLIRLQVNKAKFNLLYHMDSNTPVSSTSLSDYPVLPLHPSTSSLSLMFRSEFPLFEDSEFVLFLIDAGTCIYLDNNEENRFFLSSQNPSKILNIKTDTNCDKFNPKLLLLEIPPDEQKKFMNDAINQAYPAAGLASFDALSAKLLSDPDLVRTIIQIYEDQSNSYVLFKAVYLEFQVQSSSSSASSPFYEVNVREIGQHVMRFDIATNFESDIFYYCAPGIFNISLSLEQIKANIQSFDISNSRRLTPSQMFKLSLLPSPVGLQSLSLKLPTLDTVSPPLTLLTELSSSINQASSSSGIKASSFGTKQFEKNIIYDALSISSFTQVYTVRLFPLKSSTSYSLNLFLRNPLASNPLSHSIRFSTLSSSPKITKLSLAVNRKLNWKTTSSLLCKLCTLFRVPSHLVWTSDGISCDLSAMWTMHSLHFAYVDSLETQSTKNSEPIPDLEILVYDSLSALENKKISSFLLSRSSDATLLEDISSSIGDSTLVSAISSIATFAPLSPASPSTFNLNSIQLTQSSSTLLSLSNIQCDPSLLTPLVPLMITSSKFNVSVLESLFDSPSTTAIKQLSQGFELQEFTLKPDKSSFMLNVYNFHHATYFNENCDALKSNDFSIPILEPVDSENDAVYVWIFLIDDNVKSLKAVSSVYSIKITPSQSTTNTINPNSGNIWFSTLSIIYLFFLIK